MWRLWSLWFYLGRQGVLVRVRFLILLGCSVLTLYSKRGILNWCATVGLSIIPTLDKILEILMKQQLETSPKWATSSPMPSMLLGEESQLRDSFSRIIIPVLEHLRSIWVLCVDLSWPQEGTWHGAKLGTAREAGKYDIGGDPGVGYFCPAWKIGGRLYPMVGLIPSPCWWSVTYLRALRLSQLGLWIFNDIVLNSWSHGIVTPDLQFWANAIYIYIYLYWLHNIQEVVTQLPVTIMGSQKLTISTRYPDFLAWW